MLPRALVSDEVLGSAGEECPHVLGGYVEDAPEGFFGIEGDVQRDHDVHPPLEVVAVHDRP